MTLVVSATSGQTFVNVTASAGITHNAIPPGGPVAPTFAQVQSGGAAAGDFDGDGWVDLYITRYFDTDLLYRNNGNGTFSDVTATSFPGGIGDFETNGAAWGDIDNDGDLDLAVASINETQHYLYINEGGQFTEQAVARGVNTVGGGSLPTTAGTSFSMGDYDNDGYLDMYVTEWRNFTTTADQVQARLFHNLGQSNPGHFEDVTYTAGVGMEITSGIHTDKALSFTPRFTDLDRDGLVDIAVVSDVKTSRVFWNDGDGTFTDGTAAAGINTGTNDMGFTLGDFNGDGLLDWYATSIGTGSNAPPSGNRLFLNDGDRTFTDVTSATGSREGGWGWGADTLDFDHDGDLDIVHTNGMTIAQQDQSVLFQNIGNRTNPGFLNRASDLGIVDAGQGRGLLTLDYDNDGDLDILIINYNSAPVLYRNDTANANEWLKIKTVGTLSNRDGIGAFITVTPDLDNPDVFYVNEVDGSSNYLAQSEMIAHFGLGNITSIDQITIEWPGSGITQVLTNIAPNQLLTLVESTSLLCDFDLDGDVDLDDFDILSANYGITSGATLLRGDADHDGDVDLHDFALLSLHFGESELDQVSPLPEPGTLVLALLVCLYAGGSLRTRL